MPKRTLSDEQDAYLRAIAPGKSVRECTDELNRHFNKCFTYSQIRSYKSNHGIVSGKQPWEFVDHSVMSIMTAEQDKFIRSFAKGLGNEELTKLFNDTFGTVFTDKQVKAYKRNHKISSGLTGQFKKGNVPVNKGTKGMFNVGGNSTSFKKGQSPKNIDPIGTEKIDKDGYIYVKVNDIPKAKKKVNWKQKHKLLWEKHNGPVPEGNKIIFADGNNQNIEIDNLIMVSDSELLVMNRAKLISNNVEITKTGAIIAKIIDKTNKINKS